MPVGFEVQPEASFLRNLVCAAPEWRNLDYQKEYITKDNAAYWDGRDSLGQKVASGIYYYTLQVGEAIPQSGAEEFSATRKMVILK